MGQEILWVLGGKKGAQWLLPWSFQEDPAHLGLRWCSRQKLHLRSCRNCVRCSRWSTVERVTIHTSVPRFQRHRALLSLPLWPSPGLG